MGVVADDTLGGSDAAARGDRHLGFGGPLGRRRFSGRGLGRLRLCGGGCRRSLGLGRRHRGSRLCGLGRATGSTAPRPPSHRGLGRRRGHRKPRGLGRAPRPRSHRGLEGAAAAAGSAGAGGAGGAGSGSGCGASGSSISTTGGGGGFNSPSRSALRRTRSAWASTMLEEWDLTPMLSATQSSSVSWLVSPSSLASSWTRIFPGKECPLQDSARSAGPGTSPERDGHALRSLSISPGRTSARKALPKARRRRAASKQAMPAHSQAPRPAPGPSLSPPPAAMRTRRISALGRRVRQPIQVRTGLRRCPPALRATLPCRNRRPRRLRPGPGPWPRPRPPR